MGPLVHFTSGDRAAALIAIPWAGAGAAPFHEWSECVSGTTDLIGVRLAARETRFAEEPATTVGDVAKELADQIAIEVDRPMAIFGQCSGGLIAFEVARRLRSIGYEHLVHLLVGGQEAPGHIAIPKPADGLRNELAAFGMALGGALADDELFEMLRPALEADIAALRCYAYEPDDPLEFPITVFIGDDDRHVDHSALDPWGGLTAAAYELVRLPGDHMFSGTAWRSLGMAVDDRLQQTLRTEPS